MSSDNNLNSSSISSADATSSQPTNNEDAESTTSSTSHRSSGRARKPNQKLAEDEENKKGGDAVIPPIPKIPWKNEFPQAKHEKFLSKAGKEFNGRYLLLETLPSDFELEEFYEDSRAQRWLLVCAGSRSVKLGHRLPSNPFKPGCKTLQTMISSAWMSKCGQFFIYPRKNFAFEADEDCHQNEWVGNAQFIEYPAFPKKESEFLFSGPRNWVYTVEKLRRATENHRDVSSASDSASGKSRNKFSPVKLQPVIRPMAEQRRIENLKVKPKSGIKKPKGKSDSPEKVDQQQKMSEDLVGADAHSPSSVKNASKKANGEAGPDEKITRKAEKSPAPANEGKHRFILIEFIKYQFALETEIFPNFTKLYSSNSKAN
jgi:hypothetical protein